MPIGPLGDEAVGLQIYETGSVGEFADQCIVDAGELLARVVGVGGRCADFGVRAQVPMQGVEEETVIVLAGSHCGLVEGP
jgi:hypothetical protein